jgi:hypothetical protein
MIGRLPGEPQTLPPAGGVDGLESFGMNLKFSRAGANHR